MQTPPARAPSAPISHTDPPYIARPKDSVITCNMYQFKLELIYLNNLHIFATLLGASPNNQTNTTYSFTVLLLFSVFCFVLSQHYPGPEKGDNIVFLCSFYLRGLRSRAFNLNYQIT